MRTGVKMSRMENKPLTYDYTDHIETTALARAQNMEKTIKISIYKTKHINGKGG